MVELGTIETRMPQSGLEDFIQADLLTDESNHESFAAPESDPSTNVFERAMNLGHNALLHLRNRAAFSGGRLSRVLATGLATVAGVDMIATSDTYAKTPLLNPSNTIIPIEGYYGTMLGQSAVKPFRIQNVKLSAHRLSQSGPCVYDSSGVPKSLVNSTLDTPSGHNTTYCASKLGGRSTHLFIPRSKIISNPSMNFQPVLTQQGDKAALSAGVASASHGLPTGMNITLSPKQHRGEADVFYGRSAPSAPGTKQLKELKFITHGVREIVRKIWY